MKSSAQQFKQELDKAYSGNISKSASPGGMMTDMVKYSSEMKETNKLKGGNADNKTIKDLAKKHAYDDSKDSTSSDKINKMLVHLKKQFEQGLKVEKEHTKDESKAKEIVMDHLDEDPNYYTKLKKIERQENNEATGSGSAGAYEGPLFGGETEFAKKSDSETPRLETKESEGLKLTQNERDMVNGIVDIVKQVKDMRNRQSIANDMIQKFKRENIKFDYDRFLDMCGLKKEKKIEEQVEKVEATEATGSGSVGGYSSPAMWAKSTKKKDWGPSRKTQIPGGGFVKVKKKCTKFPYCNQGDINALKITKNESVKEAIKNVAKNMGVSENVIKTILEHEYEKAQKRKK